MNIKFVLAAAAAVFTMNVFASEVVLDVRTPEEIAETGIVKGALSADVRSPTFKTSMEVLGLKPDKDEIKVYCKSGKRAETAVQILKDMGYQHVTNLGGYEEAAKTLDRPLVKP